MQKPFVDIILPCFNPEKDWATNIVNSYYSILQDAKSWIPRLIIVNDGSTKGISDADINYLKNKIKYITWINYDQNKGKGYALRQGVGVSNSQYIIYTDIDFPYTHESIITMINTLIENKADVLAGERNNDYYKHTPYARKILSKFFKKIVRNLLKINVSDTQAGLKGMNQKAKEAFLATTIDRYLFDIEFLWLAGKKYKIEPFPVTLKKNIVFSKMNSKILLTESINFIKFFIKTI